MLAAIVAAAALDATAQSSGGAFEIPRHTIAGGGRSAGGNYVLEGSIAQHAAGATAVGGAFALSPGFWHGVVAAAPGPDPVFKDGFE